MVVPLEGAYRSSVLHLTEVAIEGKVFGRHVEDVSLDDSRTICATGGTWTPLLYTNHSGTTFPNTWTLQNNVMAEHLDTEILTVEVQN